MPECINADDSEAVLQGCLTQMRTFGGCIGLAIGAIVLNAAVSSSTTLVRALTASQRAQLYKSPLVIAEFSPDQQKLVAGVYADAFTKQMRVCTYVAAAAFVVSLLTIERRPSPPASRRLKIAPTEPPGQQHIGEEAASTEKSAKSHAEGLI